MTQMIRMSTVNGEGLALKKYEELVFPIFEDTDPIKAVEIAKAFKYVEGDKIICTYPKCGTHWMMNMVIKLKSFDTSKRPPEDILEFAKEDSYDSQESPRVIFTYFGPNRLPPDHIRNGGKIALMLRNPKDVMVSYYYHFKNAVSFNSKQTWDEYFKSFVSGDVLMGSYFDLLAEWERVLEEKSKGRNNMQVQVFFYEDFKANPKENLVRLNQHLDFNRDEEYLERVLKETTLDKLREADLSRNESHPLTLDAEGKSVIYRKGIVGDWKHLFTVAQSEEVDKILKERLKTDMFQFNYGDKK